MKGNEIIMVGEKIILLHDKVICGFLLSVVKKMIDAVDIDEDKKKVGNEAIELCWRWVERGDITADDLYELIDNAECSGISEYGENEHKKEIKEMWYILVDTVSYVTRIAYMNEGIKYLPQAIEGINKESILTLMHNIECVGIISEEELDNYQEKIASKHFECKYENIKKSDFEF